MALYDEFKTKSSEELKSYIVDDECSPEITELATQMLRERNESLGELLYGEAPSLDSEEGTEEKLEGEPESNGWILIFCAYLFFVSIASVFGLAVEGLHSNKIAAAIEVIIRCFLAIYVYYSVCKRKPNTVFVCLTASIYWFSGYFFALFCYPLSDIGMLSGIIISLCVSLAWILYFIFSKQVERIFPKKKRRVFPRDKIFFFILMFFCLFGGLGIIINGAKNLQEISTPKPTALISRNECTDGVIAFSVPNGYYCEMNNIPNTHFYITKAKDSVEVSCGFAYGYDERDQNNTVNELFDDMRDKLQSKGTENSTLSVFEQKGNVYMYHRRYAYSDANSADEAVELDAYVLWRIGTNKYAVVKEVRLLNTPSSTIEAIVNSLRFK
ncbi:MAG: DUF2569 domain-containing protein [Paludibacteraceae bacterium]|nr:DUF2569 domain-containing protein [Paludibacteraceae bacterium]